MGKPVKLTDQKKDWFLKRHSTKRQFRVRPLRERYLIVCEGAKTEPNYFKALRQLLPKNIVEIEIKGIGANTLSLVDIAEAVRDKASNSDYPFDHVWVIFDRDSFPPDNFDNAIHRAAALGIKAGWSNEAFELWYLLHFEERITGLSRTEFKKKLTNYLGQTYKKNATDMYELLQDHGNEDDAMRRANRLHELHSGNTPSRSNPCTHVNKLVKALNEYRVP